MMSGDEQPELRKKLDMEIVRGERNRRVVLAVIAVIVGGIIMAAGIVVIGGAEEVYHGADTAYSYWNSPRLEIGIFVTLIGTVVMALSANCLTKSWRV